jgi:hypothetical protein
VVGWRAASREARRSIFLGPFLVSSVTWYAAEILDDGESIGAGNVWAVHLVWLGQHHVADAELTVALVRPHGGHRALCDDLETVAVVRVPRKHFTGFHGEHGEAGCLRVLRVTHHEEAERHSRLLRVDQEWPQIFGRDAPPEACFVW